MKALTKNVLRALSKIGRPRSDYAKYFPPEGATTAITATTATTATTAISTVDFLKIDDHVEDNSSESINEIRHLLLTWDDLLNEVGLPLDHESLQRVQTIVAGMLASYDAWVQYEDDAISSSVVRSEGAVSAHESAVDCEEQTIEILESGLLVSTAKDVGSGTAAPGKVITNCLLFGLLLLSLNEH